MSDPPGDALIRACAALHTKHAEHDGPYVTSRNTCLAKPGRGWVPAPYFGGSGSGARNQLSASAFALFSVTTAPFTVMRMNGL